MAKYYDLGSSRSPQKSSCPASILNSRHHLTESQKHRGWLIDRKNHKKLYAWEDWFALTSALSILRKPVRNHLRHKATRRTDYRFYSAELGYRRRDFWWDWRKSNPARNSSPAPDDFIIAAETVRNGRDSSNSWSYRIHMGNYRLFLPR